MEMEGSENEEVGGEGVEPGTPVRKSAAKRQELLSISVTEYRQRALECLTKSWKVGENGIDAIAGGE